MKKKKKCPGFLRSDMDKREGYFISIFRRTMKVCVVHVVKQQFFKKKKKRNLASLSLWKMFCLKYGNTLMTGSNV